ncbi:MAG: hypothetical protein KGJ35_03050 [Patescibacteria group bacterium]|nr:hypothetical protein [Patescibacteria group bacterium]
MKDILQSKKILAIASVLAILAFIVIIFELGVMVGYRKAAFEYNWGNNYYRVFGQKNSMIGMMGDLDDLPAAHGVMGTIIRVQPPYAFIEGPNNEEKTIFIGSSTNVVKYHTSINPSNLSEGEYIVVVGSPNASTSQIDANFVRVLPPPPGASSTVN